MDALLLGFDRILARDGVEIKPRRAIAKLESGRGTDANGLLLGSPAEHPRIKRPESQIRAFVVDR